MRHVHSNFDDQYENRHIYDVDYPEELVFAESECCQVAVMLTDSEEIPESGQAVQLTVTDTASAKSYTETRYIGTDITRKVVFDIARYIQILLGALQPDTLFDYSSNSALVTQKQFTVTLRAFSSNFFTATFEACHGNDNATDRWWSKERKLRWWTAYPFAFDFPNTEEVSKTIIGGASSTLNFPQVLTTLNHPRVRVKASYLDANGNSYSITSAFKSYGMEFGIAGASDTGHVQGSSLLKETQNTVTLLANKCPADRRAVYLRWLNAHGEMVHWLFSPYRESATAAATVHQRAQADPTCYLDGIRDDGRIHEGKMSRELTVNTGYLQGWEYDIVSSIFNAPFVDMLDMESYIDEEEIRWTRCLVKPATYQRNLKNRNDSDHNSQIAVTLDLGEERSLVL